MELKFLRWISPFRGLPVDDKGASSPLATVTGETVQLYYYNSGVLTTDAGQAAGTIVVAKLAYDNIKNALGSAEGVPQDRSLSFTSTALTNEVARDIEAYDLLDGVAGSERATFITSGMSNGDYCVDYAHGVIYGKKASTQTSLASTTYKVKTTAGTGTAASQVQGNIASLATDSGNPVKTGGVYNSTAPTATNGQRVDTQMDVNGNTQVNLFTAIRGENTTDDTMKTQSVPVSSNVGAISPDVSSALEASTISKASAGRFYGLFGRIDKTAGSGDKWIHAVNSATLPANGAVTLLASIKKVHVNGTDTFVDLDLQRYGIYASAGIVVYISTTEFTKTIDGAYWSGTVLVSQ